MPSTSNLKFKVQGRNQRKLHGEESSPFSSAFSSSSCKFSSMRRKTEICKEYKCFSTIIEFEEIIIL